MRSLFIACALALLLLPTDAERTLAQAPRPDLRQLHELAVFGTVRIQVSSTSWGTDWLLEQSGPHS